MTQLGWAKYSIIRSLDECQLKFIRFDLQVCARKVIDLISVMVYAGNIPEGPERSKLFGHRKGRDLHIR